MDGTSSPRVLMITFTWDSHRLLLRPCAQCHVARTVISGALWAILSASSHLSMCSVERRVSLQAAHMRCFSACLARVNRQWMRQSPDSQPPSRQTGRQAGRQAEQNQHGRTKQYTIQQAHNTYGTVLHFYLSVITDQEEILERDSLVLRLIAPHT